MPLLLHLASSDPASAEGRRISLVDRLTIGRGGDNDVVLSDPERHLSKNHCVITFDGAVCRITDTSLNGVFLGDGPERLPKGTPTPLREGNVVRLGGYFITIGPVVAAAPPAPEVKASALSAVDEGPFGDVLSGSPLAPRDRSGEVSPNAGFPAPPIPDDIDFFAKAEGRAEPARAEHWHGASHPDHAQADQAFFAPPRAVIEKIPDDWDVSAFGAIAPPGPKRQTASESERSSPVRSDKLPRGSAPPAAGEAADSEAVARFLAAIGLAGTSLTAADKSDLMQRAGEMLVAAIGGLTEVLAARSSIKQEFRIERTAIGALGNNPLKFSASPDEAMRIMLLGRARGFMPPKEAVGEALTDIKNHQLAMLAGMQVALETVIRRFDPDKLEKRLEQGSLLEGILPAARKARYWDLFRALYKEIATELQEDFQKAFGAEFARAYRDQVNRL
jgi:type VI secretion system protein